MIQGVVQDDIEYCNSCDGCYFGIQPVNVLFEPQGFGEEGYQEPHGLFCRGGCEPAKCQQAAWSQA